VGGALPGAGFFLAPGLVVTCAHVTGDVEELEVLWRPDAAPVPARLELKLCDRGRPVPDLAADYPDIALLRVEAAGHPCVALDEDMPTYGDSFQSYGYPEEGGSVLLTPAALDYRGTKSQHPTPFIDLASDTVKPGMSGGPLLNVRSKAVCGVLVATRSPSSPDGGLAVPWVAVRDQLAEAMGANRAFHAANHSWSDVARPAGRRVRFRLPHVVKHFSGRGPELETLERALADDSRAIVTQAITGLGGVGKSQLAARYVQKHVDDYDVVAWIRAEDGGIADLADLALELGEEVEGLAPADRAQVAVRVLENAGARWLLVLDNVATPEQLAVCCPATGNGNVLVTSRNRAVGEFGALLDVDVFEDEVGADFLVGRAGRDGEREAALRLTRALGGLPLALAHAGAYCSSGTSFDEYLKMLTELPSAEVFDESPEAFYSQTVASTWQVSIDAAAERASLAPAVLGMASYLAPDKIPLPLFRVLLGDPNNIRERKRLSDAFNALHGLSLVEVGEASLSVHRLLQKTVRDQARLGGDEEGPAFAARAVLVAFPKDRRVPSEWPRCEELLPHAAAMAHTIEPRPERTDVAEVLRRACGYLLEVRDVRRGVPMAESALEYSQHALGPAHERTLAALANLANAVWAAGRTKDALDLEERVLEDYERVFGSDHPSTLMVRANLAASYHSAGRTEAAIAAFERVIAARKRLLGDDHEDTLTARAGLAGAYMAASRADDAIALYEAVIATRERTLGAEYPTTLTARISLGSALTEAGRSADAVRLMEGTLEVASAILGPNHPDTLAARSILGGAYDAEGRAGEAIALRSAALSCAEEILGRLHPDVLIMKNNLAASLERAHRIDEAIALRESVIAGAESTLGAAHPHSLTYRANLGVTFAKAGRHADAVELLTDVAAEMERVLGPEDANTLALRAFLQS
jgi:tetratricopeptide (TPR) repeat protein